ncbi:MAG: DASS family sodium-coupled anion symporter [Phycisphaeraceae bacterium]|nr:DASS family sodium-coupled anion symporter [Phycisphaeraceae bacterium]
MGAGSLLGSHSAGQSSQTHGEEVLPPRAVRWAGLLLGPTLALFTWIAIRGDQAIVAESAVSAVPASAAELSELSREGAVVLSLIVWMATWWLTQAVELSTTALLPLLVLPLAGVTRGVGEAAAPFASEIIFLFAGGCLLATALERHGLSQRMATAMLRLAGPRPVLIVGVFMVTAACISAFVSNTATVAMMLPLAIAAVVHAEQGAPDQPDRARRVMLFGSAVLLATAYGASIGGSLTLIGSPPNAIAAQLYNAGRPDEERLTFLGWLRFSAPAVALFLPLAWFLLAFVLVPVRSLQLSKGWLPSSDAASRESGRQPFSREAWFTLVVFAITVALWVSMPWLPARIASLRDAGVAVLAGVLLLLVPLGKDPARTALNWRDAAGLPWGVFILFGGGLSIASAMEKHGVALWLSRAFHGLEGAPELLVIAAVIVAILFMTELASNTAIAATGIPVLLALAPALGIPAERLVVPAAFAASWAFMLPVGTPPNALVFASGRVPAIVMAKTGFILNLVGAALLSLVAMALL